MTYLVEIDREACLVNRMMGSTLYRTGARVNGKFQAQYKEHFALIRFRSISGALQDGFIKVKNS